MRLSHKDFDLLQRTLFDLYEYRTLTELRGALSRIILKLIPADHFGVVMYDLNPATGGAKMVDRIDSGRRLSPEVIYYWEQHLDTHPFTRYFRGGGEMTALMLSDFFTTKQLRNSHYWETVVKVLEYDRMISLPVACSTPVSAAAIGRRGKHFTERDRLVLNLLRPHFNQAWRNAQVATSRSGATTRPLADYGLLPRETEVAHWLGKGKTNPEIAMILGVSSRTVEKHVERILVKLGVENRTAAAVIISAAGHENSTNNTSFPRRF